MIAHVEVVIVGRPACNATRSENRMCHHIHPQVQLGVSRLCKYNAHKVVEWKFQVIIDAGPVMVRCTNEMSVDSCGTFRSTMEGTTSGSSTPEYLHVFDCVLS